MKTMRRGRRGFTLIEVAMAMLVVSVGIMAAFAMFPQGLDQGKAAVEDTQAAQFAEWVFDGYRGLSTRYAWSLWPTAPVQLPGAANFNSAQTTPWVRASVNSNIVTVFRAFRQVSQSTAGIDAREIALRYNLALDRGNRSVGLTLRVWPGEYGNTDATNAVMFYTEILNTSL